MRPSFCRRSLLQEWSAVLAELAADFEMACEEPIAEPRVLALGDPFQRFPLSEGNLRDLLVDKLGPHSRQRIQRFSPMSLRLLAINSLR
jgi:hypothetical protein